MNYHQESARASADFRIHQAVRHYCEVLDKNVSDDALSDITEFVLDYLDKATHDGTPPDPDYLDQQESSAVLNQQRALNNRPLESDERRFGVTWATAGHSIWQTGYVYTYDEALEVARKDPLSVTDTPVDSMCLCHSHVGIQVYGRVEDEADAYEEIVVEINAPTP